MKMIPLTKGQFAKVDDEYYDALMKHKWYASARPRGKFIARRAIRGHKCISMHRFLMKVTDCKMVIDHINGNPLDNTMANLRICTTQQNACNRIKKVTNKTGYKGVSYKKGRLSATIEVNGQETWLGFFDTAQQAALAYNKAAIKLHGEYAKLNEIGLPELK